MSSASGARRSQRSPRSSPLPAATQGAAPASFPPNLACLPVSQASARTGGTVRPCMGSLSNHTCPSYEGMRHQLPITAPSTPYAPVSLQCRPTECCLPPRAYLECTDERTWRRRKYDGATHLQATQPVWVFARISGPPFLAWAKQRLPPLAERATTGARPVSLLHWAVLFPPTTAPSSRNTRNRRLSF